jgi:hypothetical protein
LAGGQGDWLEKNAQLAGGKERVTPGQGLLPRSWGKGLWGQSKAFLVVLSHPVWSCLDHMQELCDIRRNFPHVSQSHLPLE